jgi:hypothetical protein
MIFLTSINEAESKIMYINFLTIKVVFRFMGYFK